MDCDRHPRLQFGQGIAFSPTWKVWALQSAQMRAKLARAKIYPQLTKCWNLYADVTEHIFGLIQWWSAVQKKNTVTEVTTNDETNKLANEVLKVKI